jgi:hypothetical protein
LYDKKTQQSYWWHSYIAGTLPEAILSSIHFMEDDTFYAVVEPFYIKSYLNEIEKRDIEYNYSHISSQLKDIYSLVRNVEESENPIVFLFTLN